MIKVGRTAIFLRVVVVFLLVMAVALSAAPSMAQTTADSTPAAEEESTPEETEPTDSPELNLDGTPVVEDESPTSTAESPDEAQSTGEPEAATEGEVDPESMTITPYSAEDPTSITWRDRYQAPNPAMPERCGLSIALVFDMSNSLSLADVRRSKEAGLGVIDSLAGTPTELGIYNFSSHAPSDSSTPNVPSTDLATDQGVAEAEAAVNNLRQPPRYVNGTFNGGTNWDGALQSVADSGVAYDVVYFITDGEPSTNNKRTAGDYGDIVRDSDITEAIDSANVLKESGIRVEVLSVGLRNTNVWADNTTQDWLGRPVGTSEPATGLDVSRTISSDDAVTHVDDYANLAAHLREIATRNCEGTVIVEKEIVDADGVVIDDPEHPVSGWEFTASDVESEDPLNPIHLVDSEGQPIGDSRTSVTDEEGSILFRVEAERPAALGWLTIAETQQEGYSLRKQDGKNAVCTDRTGYPVTVTDVEGDDAFRVGMGTDETVTCTVQNQVEDSSFMVEKQPQADQHPELEGDQSNTTVQFDGTFTARYDIIVTNNGASAATLQSPVVDTVTFPEGFDVTDVVFTLDGEEIPGVQVNGTEYEIPAEALGEFAPESSKTIAVEVSGKATEAGQTSISDETYETCEAANPSSGDAPRSLFNGVSLDGEVDPDGDTNNYACVDPQLPGISVSKTTVDANGDGVIDTADSGQVGSDGTRYVSYTVTVTNPEDGIERTYSLTDTPDFAGAVNIVRSEISSEHTATSPETFEGVGPYDITADMNNGEEVTITPGESHEYAVDVYFTGPDGAETRDESWECSAAEGDNGQGLLNKVEMRSGTVTDEDEDCAPLPDPEKVNLRVEKVDGDDNTLPLTGAAFAVHQANPDGSIGEKVSDLTEGHGGFHTTELEAGVEYFLVETKSPEDYQLLPTAVKFDIQMTDTGAELRLLNQDEAIGATVQESTDSDSPLVVMQIADIRIGDLPKSGGVGVGVYALLAALLIGIGVLTARRRA